MNDAITNTRNEYINQLFRILDNKTLVIMCGVRRVGKSRIAMQLAEELEKRFADEANVIRIDYEKTQFAPATADELAAFLKGRFASNKRNYILLDEIIHVADWERVVNFFYRLDNCKLILISSNRLIFSQELLAIQEDNYDEVHVYPLSFKEFLDFQRFDEITEASVPLSEKLYKGFDGEICTIQEIYEHYAIYGGLPIMWTEYMDSERAWVVTDGFYGAIVSRDILEIYKGGYTTLTDPVLLRNVISVIAKGIGESISATWISKQTSSQLERPIAVKTVQSYIRSLLNANLLYFAERFDLRSGQVMKTMGKYYLVDASYNSYLLNSFGNVEYGLLENNVYLELRRRGYTVYNGKLGNEEITFVAMKDKETIYIQVAKDKSENYMEKLLSPFRKIRDDSMKILIALYTDDHTALSVTYEGFIVMNGLEFLMGNDFRW